MYRKKGRVSNPQNLPATTTLPKTGNVLKMDNSWQKGAIIYNNVSDREYISTPGRRCDNYHTKRKSQRTRANGIVALTNFARPVVTKIYDIAAGGVSFLHADEMDITESVITMDILIFDIIAHFEYLINQVKGRVVSKKLVADPPKGRAPVWRYSVEFIDLDSAKRKSLEILPNQIPPLNDQVYHECCHKTVHDS